MRKKHKIFTFDVNAYGIDDKVINHVNKLNSSGSGYQGNDLVVYLGVPNDKYILSLNIVNPDEKDAAHITKRAFPKKCVTAYNPITGE